MMTVIRAAFWSMLASLFAIAPAIAASAVNLDNEPRTIAVTEGGTERTIVIAPGDSAEFCPDGCFIRMPDGNVEVLSGFEVIEISGGIATIR